MPASHVQKRRCCDSLGKSNFAGQVCAIAFQKLKQLKIVVSDSQESRRSARVSLSIDINLALPTEKLHVSLSLGQVVVGSAEKHFSQFVVIALHRDMDEAFVRMTHTRQ